MHTIIVQYPTDGIPTRNKGLRFDCAYQPFFQFVPLLLTFVTLTCRLNLVTVYSSLLRTSFLKSIVTYLEKVSVIIFHLPSLIMKTYFTDQINSRKIVSEKSCSHYMHTHHGVTDCVKSMPSLTRFTYYWKKPTRRTFKTLTPLSILLT